MPKLVQKSGYIKAGKAGGYMRYIATRENVEKLDGNGPVTQNQQQLIAELLRDFPDTKELHEYADYSAAPTFGNASALITMALDMNVSEMQDRDGYMKYIATRPRVERHGEHGLFSSAASVSLDAALKELEAHDGNVWTLIYSLRREDAERLGYDNADAWRTLIRSKQVELATAMKISPDKFRWYAAFHDEGTHPHIHMMVWSDDPKQGYLSKDGIVQMRSKMTNAIFQDEMLNLYQQKDRSYKEVTQAARDAMRELISEMQQSICDSPEIEQQLVALSESLASAKGKKQYQYLKKDVKHQVDAIVDSLSALPQVAECYEQWNLLKDELDNYYHDHERERLPLSRQKEFRAIKNMVIKEADDLRLGTMTFEDEGMNDEPEREDELIYLDDEQVQAYYQAKDRLYDDYATREEKAEAVSTLEDLVDVGSSDAAYLLGKAWRDGLCAPPWDEEAEKWFRLAAEAGNDCAQYALGKLLLEQQRDEEAIDWLERSADKGNSSALYLLGKLELTGEVVQKNAEWAVADLTAAAEQRNKYAQYALGKFYLQGEDVEQDIEQAEYWLSQAAYQGNEYAQFFLDHMDEQRKPSIMLAATRLLHHLGNIFRENTPTAAAPGTLQIDHKRAREIMEKRIALGHKADDHVSAEDLKYTQPTMSAPW